MRRTNYMRFHHWEHILSFLKRGEVIATRGIFVILSIVTMRTGHETSVADTPCLGHRERATILVSPGR